jgi:glycerophosphoryl diester phosphodiesterase
MRTIGWLVVCAVIFSCSNARNAGTAASNTTAGPADTIFDKQGHRGSRGLMPENTWPAMRTALDLNVTTLEMDIAFTKDKKAVLSHEPWFGKDITTKPDGSYMGEREERKFNIYWMTYDDVKTFDVGLKPHPRFPRQQKMKAVKPLLTDVLDSVQQYMMTRRRPMPNFNIETKTVPLFDGVFAPKPEEFIELIVAILKEKGVIDRATIQSFDFRTLQYLHQKYPDVKTAMLIEATDKRSFDDQVKELGFTPTVYSPAYEIVTADLIKKCKKKNMKIIPWTVNEKEKIEELKKMGVDGIITDYPDLF